MAEVTKASVFGARKWRDNQRRAAAPSHIPREEKESRYVDVPRRKKNPARPRALPFLGKRGYVLSTSEFNMLDRIMDAPRLNRRMNYFSSTILYRILFAPMRRASLKKVKFLKVRVSKKNAKRKSTFVPPEFRPIDMSEVSTAFHNLVNKNFDFGPWSSFPPPKHLLTRDVFMNIRINGASDDGFFDTSIDAMVNPVTKVIYGTNNHRLKSRNNRAARRALLQLERKSGEKPGKLFEPPVVVPLNGEVTGKDDVLRIFHLAGPVYQEFHLLSDATVICTVEMRNNLYILPPKVISKDEFLRWARSLPDSTIIEHDFVVVSDLNGNNGSSTNTDDVESSTGKSSGKDSQAERARANKESKNHQHSRPLTAGIDRALSQLPSVSSTISTVNVTRPTGQRDFVYLKDKRVPVEEWNGPLPRATSRVWIPKSYPAAPEETKPPSTSSLTQSERQEKEKIELPDLPEPVLKVIPTMRNKKTSIFRYAYYWYCLFYDLFRLLFLIPVLAPLLITTPLYGILGPWLFAPSKIFPIISDSDRADKITTYKYLPDMSEFMERYNATITAPVYADLEHHLVGRSIGAKPSDGHLDLMKERALLFISTRYKDGASLVNHKILVNTCVSALSQVYILRKVSQEHGAFGTGIPTLPHH